MKTAILHLIIGLSLTAFISSCNTGNKVVSSFGKRKYTKGYYYASAGKNKSAIPAHTDEKTNTTISSNSSNSEVQASDISANNKKTPVTSQPISAPIVKHKKTFQYLPEAIGISSPVKKILDNIFPEPTGVPGHGDLNDIDSSKYDRYARLSWMLLVASVLVSVIAIISVLLSPLLLLLGALIATSLSLASIILGSEAYHHGKEVPTIILSIVIFILQVIALLFLIALIPLLFGAGYI